MYDAEKCSAVLANVTGFVRQDAHIYLYIYKNYGLKTKWQHWGMLIHQGNKLRVPPNAVPALNSWRFRYLCVLSCINTDSVGTVYVCPLYLSSYSYLANLLRNISTI